MPLRFDQWAISYTWLRTPVPGAASRTGFDLGHLYLDEPVVTLSAGEIALWCEEVGREKRCSIVPISIWPLRHPAHTPAPDTSSLVDPASAEGIPPLGAVRHLSPSVRKQLAQGILWLDAFWRNKRVSTREEWTDWLIIEDCEAAIDTYLRTRARILAAPKESPNE